MGADRRRRAWLRGLCGMFSSFFGSGSGGSSGVDFCVISPPPQRKHAKEFRDRTFNVIFFMLCKMLRFIKNPELGVPAFSNQGEKSCILRCVSTVIKSRKRTTERRFVRALIWRVPQKFRASRHCYHQKGKEIQIEEGQHQQQIKEWQTKAEEGRLLLTS